MQKLSWKEKYAGILVLLIGVLVLITQVSNMLSSKAQGFAFQNGSIIINKSELYNDLRTYVTIILGILGGILLLLNKRLGWVIGLPLLLLYTIIVAGFGIDLALSKFHDPQHNSHTGDPYLNVYVGVLGGISLLFLLASIFLLLPVAQVRYRVGKATWIPTLLFFMALTALYFFLH